MSTRPIRSRDVRTRCAYDPPQRDDGTRVLITRYWPRGLSRARVRAEWVPELAPDVGLLRDFKDSRLDWATFARRFARLTYGDEAREQLARLRSLARSGGPVTLLCVCRAGEEGEAGIHCHRRLVRQRLLGRKPSV